MLTLYTFGPAFGLPDPSPFCIKAMALLKMAGLDHECVVGDVRKAPKGKLPYLDDAGTLVPDTTFIRWHLESKFAVDFDHALSPAEKGTAWAFEKLCEDNIYWLGVHERWMDQANFDRGPRKFFDAVPAILRPLVINRVRADVKRSLRGQGIGRHSDAERAQLADTAIQAISDFLAEKPYLMGDTRCAADASVFATIASFGCDHFETRSRATIAKYPNLTAYRDRLMREWFPDFAG